MPTRPSSSASTLRGGGGGRANLRNASVSFSLFLHEASLGCYSLVLILYLKCGGGLGGGGCNVFLTFYAISNISRKKYLGIQINYFSLNVFFVVLAPLCHLAAELFKCRLVRRHRRQL